MGDVSAAEVAYKFGKDWGCDLSKADAVPVKGDQNYVTWDYIEEKYVNTQNVLSKNDISKGKTFEGYFQKSDSGDKISILVVGSEVDFEDLGAYKLRATFTVGGVEKVIEATCQLMGAFYSVLAAGETFYLLWRLCPVTPVALPKSGRPMRKSS